MTFPRKQDGGSKLQKIISHRNPTAISLKFGPNMYQQVHDTPPEGRGHETGNGFMANFQTSIIKSRFRKMRGAPLGEPEVISTRGFHRWIPDTWSRARMGFIFPILFPLPVQKLSKSKTSKSHFVKTGYVRSHAAGKPEVVFTRRLQHLTCDGQLRSAQKIA